MIRAEAFGGEVCTVCVRRITSCRFNKGCGRSGLGPGRWIFRMLLASNLAKSYSLVHVYGCLATLCQYSRQPSDGTLAVYI